MTTFAFRFAAAAAFALCAAAGAVQAGDLSGDDGYASQDYRRQTPSRYCYTHPYDARCNPGVRNVKPKSTAYSGGKRCETSIRAVGKRNLVTAFARNSAIFAWQREVRFVHGDNYAAWSLARRASIICDRATGALKSCVAVAGPCRS